ncbi:cupin domain-containing protein [Lentzea flava]|uniref:Cupin n=1 Tax=Lentzea flava TaxID=103732 RepID=A0ABQ2VAX2_9PSEU|nr:cupin domain-containing protein [Lentzea flava]MCP2204398.1 Cupin domain [Lentzea flava]GGU76998.1 cupin [Lentzea flava]
MSGLLVKHFDTPEETRPFEQGMGQLDLLNLDSGPVGRAVFQPGWRWSEHVKPIAGTDSCQVAHRGYCVSGRMKIVMDDGDEQEIGPGDLMVAAPGHDAWVLGDEPCVLVDWAGYNDYAKRS